MTATNKVLFSDIPTEILQGHILVPFCCPRDLARVLTASSGLRSLRRGCVTALLERLFEGHRSANALPWIRAHHGDKLDEVGLVDWLYGIAATVATGAFRASMGRNHTVVLTPGGRALASGLGKQGALGGRSKRNNFIFTEIDRWQGFLGRIPVAAVACGEEHTLLLTSVGSVHSCGRGEYGRLGHGTDHTLTRPTLIEALAHERITQVAAGAAHSIAVSWDGDAFTWGWGFGGLLGHGDEASRFEPTRVSPLTVPPEEEVAAGKGQGGAIRRTPSSGDPDVDEAGRVSVDTSPVDHVTCAAAGTSSTVLGTRGGRILLAGKTSDLEVDRSVAKRGFALFGRFPGGAVCRRVHHTVSMVGGEDVVAAIDSAGRVCVWNTNFGGKNVERPAGSVGGGECKGDRTQRLVSPVSLTGVPSDCADPRTFLLIKTEGYGTNSMVLVSEGRCLLVQVPYFPVPVWTVQGEPTFTDLGDRAFCAVLRFGDGTGGGDASLLVSDGGASLSTWGHGWKGNLGHGVSSYHPCPKTVESAFVLGKTIPGQGDEAARSPCVRVSIPSNDLRPGHDNGPRSSDGHDDGGEEIWGEEGARDREQSNVGILAVVDAAADERDLDEERD